MSIRFFKILLFWCAVTQAQETFEVNCNEFNIFESKHLKYYVEDSIISFEDVVKQENQIFKHNPSPNIVRFDLDKPHWFVMNLKIKQDCEEQMLFEFFDYRYQYGEVYLPESNGTYKKYEFGYLRDFGIKQYRHKNFIFDLNIKDTNTHKVYFRIKTNINSEIKGSIRNDNVFINWALNEYFYLALFYGVIISLFIYNISIFIYLKDKTYLYYTLYIAFAGIWALCNDGIGFQYIWHSYPFINLFLFPLTNLLMITFLALYVREFFKTYERLYVLDKILTLLLIARFIPHIVWISNLFHFNAHMDKYFLCDIPIIVILLLIGIKKMGLKRHARLYVIAFTFLLAGYVVFTLKYYELTYQNLFTLYSIYFSMAANMIILAIGLVSRLKSSLVETEIANRQLLQNLKEKELLKDEHNRQLELKVLQRTQELTAKNEELNSFVYRASHDIKGPISSLIGLAKIGQMEQDPEILKEYFKHVLSSSERLDKTLGDLLQLSHVNESDIRTEESNLRLIMKDIVSINKFNERYKSISIETHITDEKVFIDQRMLKPILQNLVENSLKYSDMEKENPYVKISAYTDKSKLYINVSDNGIGIPEDYQKKIFDKFFRVGVKGSGSGLGLHIVQKCIEKLGGSVEVNSIIRKGTSINVEIPL